MEISPVGCSIRPSDQGLSRQSKFGGANTRKLRPIRLPSRANRHERGWKVRAGEEANSCVELSLILHRSIAQMHRSYGPMQLARRLLGLRLRQGCMLGCIGPR